MGGVLLSTGGLAVLSAAFAVHMALGVWWPFALLAGLGWGFVVVNLDRMLLVGMAHDASLKRNLLLAVPRMGLALVLGVVIATPLTLQVFAKEIDTEIVTMQAEAADAYRASLADDARFAGPAGAARSGSPPRRPIVASGGRADAGLAVVRAEVTATPGRARRGARDVARARGQGAVRARRLLRHRRRRHGAGLRRRRGPRPTRRRRSWRRRARSWTTPSPRRRPPRRAAPPWPPRRWTTDRAELARLTAEQDRLQAAFDARTRAPAAC